MIKELICRFKGHSFAASEALTPVKILELLIEDEFVLDIAYDRELLTKIEELAKRYKKRYGNSSISNLICIKCGRKANCIEDMKEQMRKELNAFLFRPDKNSEMSDVS
jgi:hypothetical protein